MPSRKSSSIARETFKLLAVRRLTPSPDNYRALYEEIAARAGDPINSPVGAVARGLPAPQFAFALQGQVARAVHRSFPDLPPDDTVVSELGQLLGRFLCEGAVDAATLKSRIESLNTRFSLVSEDQTEVRSSLLSVLHLVLRNIAVLSVDDRWLKGQTDALLAAASPPLSLGRLDALQRRLTEVIAHQSEAKTRMVDAQEQMKQLFSAFLSRLLSMTACNQAYQGRIEECAQRIEDAQTLDEIAPVVREAFTASRAMANQALAMHSELVDMRAQTENTAAEMQKLRQDLERASALARHDPLTTALNRRGLDEALEREVASARRADRALCLALLDLDNFKAINESMGHDAGDSALVHLAEVIRACLRPQDVLARYGGEEFVLLFPDTTLELGVLVMTRLQRELTKRFFLYENEKSLITFSAGVAELNGQETGDGAIRRADKAMYAAKRAGKNRVVGA